MKEKNILAVIDELGEMITKYKEDIKFKDFEIERLEKKIQSIESYIAFYSEEHIEENDYKEVIK